MSSIKYIIGLWLCLLPVFIRAQVAPGNPLTSASVCWNFESVNDKPGLYPLTQAGEVRLNQPLMINPAESPSLDSIGANFKNGFFITGYTEKPFSLSGYQATIGIRFKADERFSNGVLITFNNPDRPYPILGFNQGHLVYEWHTTPLKQRTDSAWFAKNEPSWANPNALPTMPDMIKGILRLRAPQSVIDFSQWHTCLIRFTGLKLELFIDGALIDEEWTHGPIADFDFPLLIGNGYNEYRKIAMPFAGQMDYLAIWDRALTDDEILNLSGGSTLAKIKQNSWYPDTLITPQYWKPNGFELTAGDCMPFYHDGRFHLFYLYDRHFHHSKWHMGAHQYAHISSTDLKNWTRHPLAVPLTKPWENAMGTGDVIWHNGIYHIFYTDCGSRTEFLDKPYKGARIFTATSTDGIHFTKNEQPLIEGHDCEVFYDEPTKKFYLIRNGRECLVSDDLANWTLFMPKLVPHKEGTSDECPNYFTWNGWHYFLLGRNAIWKAQSLTGPWIEIPPTVYDGLMVPKVAEYKDNRRLLTGFLIDFWYGGNLVFRELVQQKNGDIGTRFVPELIPETGPAIDLSASSENKVLKKGQLQVNGANGAFSFQSLNHIPSNAIVELTIDPRKTNGKFGLCLRGEGEYAYGCELVFDPSGQRVYFSEPLNGRSGPAYTGPASYGYHSHIEQVENLSKPIAVTLVMRGDIVDVYLNNQRTLITKLRTQLRGDRLFFFTESGDLNVSNISIKPIIN